MTRRYVAALAALLSCFPSSASAQQYDLVIRNGHIIDGTGSPWYGADIAIKDGHIVKIGRLNAASTAKSIDAHGLTVAPGFIDMLGQSELSILVNPHVPSKIFQGITTEITGEGNSIAPSDDRMIAEDRASFDHYKITPDWRDFQGYFKRLETQGIGINLASYVGATTVRRMVIGNDNRVPTTEELTRMRSLVLDAMHQGAMGLSTALQYAPAPYAKTEELIALASTAAGAGGIYATHMRSEGDAVFEALDETFRIGSEAKIPVEIWHLKAAGKPNWGKMPEIVERIDRARASGIDVGADSYAYTAWANSFSAFVPPWAHDGGDDAMVARIKDPAQRAKIRETMLHDRNWDNEWLEIAGPEGVTISSTIVEKLRPLQGKNISEIARAQGKDPIDCILDLIAEDPAMEVVVEGMSETDVADALKQPWVSVDNDSQGASPEGILGQEHPHPRGYGAFPRILRKYVREEHLLSLPDAIRKFSALPAQRLRLADRGVLKQGMWADIVIFDPEKVRDLSTYENPNQLAVGMEYVLVNGVPVIAGGKMTQALPGKVLRGPGYIQ
jgi:dihydroorotase/N-acyl-D-amino-acid deacylase